MLGTHSIKYRFDLRVDRVIAPGGNAFAAEPVDLLRGLLERAAVIV